MKVRILAVISILALAAWLPIQAQQAAAPKRSRNANYRGAGWEEQGRGWMLPR